MDKPKIFISYVPLYSGSGAVRDSTPGGDLKAFATTEDGVVIGGHVCSNEGFVKHDMGITSTRKYDIYAKQFPDGYELVWLGREPPLTESQVT